jgi:hypothetical protein
VTHQLRTYGLHEFPFTILIRKTGTWTKKEVWKLLQHGQRPVYFRNNRKPHIVVFTRSALTIDRVKSDVGHERFTLVRRRGVQEVPKVAFPVVPPEEVEHGTSALSP